MHIKTGISLNRQLSLTCRSIPALEKRALPAITLIHKVDSLEDALILANDSNYGLTAGFYGSEEEGGQFFEASETGVNYVNRPRDLQPAPGRPISRLEVGKPAAPVVLGRVGPIICSVICANRSGPSFVNRILQICLALRPTG